MEYTIDYFINKFQAIPDDKWFEGTLHSIDGRSCALGHCGVNDYIQTAEADALDSILRPLYDGKDPSLYESVFSINDKINSNYKQSTPRHRILAALHDIKKMQDGQATPLAEFQPPVKVITKYVGVPESLVQETSKLILS